MLYKTQSPFLVYVNNDYVTVKKRFIKDHEEFYNRETMEKLLFTCYVFKDNKHNNNFLVPNRFGEFYEKLILNHLNIKDNKVMNWTKIIGKNYAKDINFFLNKENVKKLPLTEVLLPRINNISMINLVEDKLDKLYTPLLKSDNNPPRILLDRKIIIDAWEEGFRLSNLIKN